MALKLKTQPEPELSLLERVEAMHAEIDAFVDRVVEEQSKHCEGVPKAMLRRLIMVRTPRGVAGDNPFCHCKALAAYFEENPQ